MQDKSPEQLLAERLRDSEQALDDDTVTRLALLRERALQEGRRQTGLPQHWQGWLVAASVAAIALLVALPQMQPSSTVGDVDALEEMALQEGFDEDLDLYENLEFYEWLAGQEDLG